MRDFIRKFFSRKINTISLSIQAIAIIFLIIAFCGVGVCSVLFFVTQGIALVFGGISILSANKQILFNQQYYDDMPYSSEEKKSFRTNDERNIKSNKFSAIVLIVFGVILISTCLSLL